MNINPNKSGVLEFMVMITIIIACLAFAAGVKIGRLQTVEPIPAWIAPNEASDK